MIILDNENKTIQIEFNHKTTGDGPFTVKLPKVTCTEKSDAECIQKEINMVICELAQKLINQGGSISENKKC